MFCLLCFKGCPSPVENIPQCFRPCPENCEDCYPDSGVCKKCRPGFHGLGCELSKYATLWGNDNFENDNSILSRTFSAVKMSDHSGNDGTARIMLILFNRRNILIWTLNIFKEAEIIYFLKWDESLLIHEKTISVVLI